MKIIALSFGLFSMLSFAFSSNKAELQTINLAERIEINYESSGCFHYASYRIILEQVNETWYASLYELKKSSFHGNNEEQPKGLIAQTVLTPEQLTAYYQFEAELVLPKRSGCTNVDTYHLIKNDTAIKVVDGSCNWQGFAKLREQLFPAISL